MECITICDDMLDLPVVDAVMRVCAGEHVVEIKNSDVVEGVIVFVQPVIEKPFVEGARIFSIGGVAQAAGR